MGSVIPLNSLDVPFYYKMQSHAELLGCHAISRNANVLIMTMGSFLCNKHKTFGDDKQDAIGDANIKCGLKLLTLRENLAARSDDGRWHYIVCTTFSV